MAYFLISVSNRTNLQLCLQYALAGFTNSINGVWTFVEVNERDFVSFLYGARVYNLYRVKRKEALRGAEHLGPWPPVTFKMSGKTYHFPYRLYLEPLRKFEEPLVRAEFAYVAENLLLRGGYRKTHFQADQTTLQVVSEMGYLVEPEIEPSGLDKGESFIPRFALKRELISPPEVWHLSEIIVQALLRQRLSSVQDLTVFLTSLKIDGLPAESLEVLGEKAFPEGHVDILIKEAVPKGLSKKVIIEVKAGAVKREDLNQLQGYTDTLGSECLGGVLLARKFPKKLVGQQPQVKFAQYQFSDIDLEKANIFEDWLKSIRFTFLQ